MKKKRLKLILPAKKYAASCLGMERAFQKEGSRTASRAMELFKRVEDFPVFRKKIMDNRKGINLYKGRVPATLYWAVVGDKVVGRLDLRHYLNKRLAKIGGHIGYSVSPSERGKGYATEMLRLGLKEARKLGIKKALVTCDETNHPSRRVIEKNGGVFKNKIMEKGVYKLRFWVPAK